MKIAFTYYPAGVRRSSLGERHEADARAVFERLTKPRETDDKFSVPAIAWATFNGRRSIETLGRSYVLGLDIDAVADLDQVFGAFGKLLSVVHTTFSSTAERPRARGYVALSRPVDLEEYRRAARFFVERLERAGHGVDIPACRDAARAWPLPAIPPGGHFEARIGEGAPLDIDALLATLPPEEPPPPVAPIESAAPASADLVERARRYLEKCEPAISGSGGHKTAFRVAQALVRGLGVDESTAFSLIMEAYNPRCQPPFLARDWIHKLKQAARFGQLPEGCLRDARRSA